MIKLHHLNCVLIESSFGPAIGHCILLEENSELALIDSGIGLLDSKEPEKRLGKKLIQATGFKFDGEFSAIRQIEKLGFSPSRVKNCICSHLDPDHIGGLADFPDMKVHISKEEYENFISGNERYLSRQLSHNPKLRIYSKNDSEWFGLPARKVDLNFSRDIYLIPLFGHTLGHCGVAFKMDKKWVFYVGDAYYLRAELTDFHHPIEQLAAIRAEDDKLRIESLNMIREVIKIHGSELEYFGYHDPTEFSVTIEK